MHAGEWVCLKNVHLVVAWLPVLEKALRGLMPHPSFRLLLTSEPHSNFPPALLEACLKVTVLYTITLLQRTICLDIKGVVSTRKALILLGSS